MSQIGFAGSCAAEVLPEAVPLPCRAASTPATAVRCGRVPAPAASGRAGKGQSAELTDLQLLRRITGPQARCAGADVDPDDWYPNATRWEQARAEAAHALALCARCPVRAECLEFSMRQWADAGRYGVWGGLLEEEREAARKEWLTGISVERLLAQGQEGNIPDGAVKDAREGAG